MRSQVRMALISAGVACLTQFALAGGLYVPRAGTAMEGYDDRMCKNAQQRADQIALNSGRSPVMLGCMVQIIQRDQLRAGEALQQERRRQSQPSTYICRDAFGSVRCEPE
jgi:hypothetical protein